MAIGSDLEPSTAQAHQAGPSAAIRWAAYLAAAAASFILTVVWFSHPAADPQGIVPGGGDILWTQAMFESVSQEGLFGNNPHLFWPDGLSPWSHPQLGILVMGSALVATQLFGVSSGMAIFWVTAAVAATNAAAVLYLLLAVARGKPAVAIATVASIAMGISPFVIGKPNHLSVAAFFLVPVAIGALLRVRRGPAAVVPLVLVAVAALLSPLWWVVVTGFLVGTTLLAWPVRRMWASLWWSAGVVGAIGVGFVLQSLLYRSAAIPGQLPTRTAWDSNILGGHLVDLLLSSPWLLTRDSSLKLLVPGASPELSQVGLVWGAAAILLIVVAVCVPPFTMRSGRDVSMLSALSISAVVWFLLGGMGNLQAGIAVLFDGESPARVWARLVLILALLGMTWLIVLVQESQLAKRIAAPYRWFAVTAAGLAMAGSTALDATTVNPPLPQPREALPEYAVAEYLRATTPPCPVAQLPLDGMPVIRVWDGSQQQIIDLYYRPLVPYLMAPEFFWTIGPYQPERTDNLNALPVQLDRAGFSYLHGLGYCAVLYDQLLADAARAAGTELEGRDLGDVDPPDFVSERYQVYLLRGEG